MQLPDKNFFYGPGPLRSLNLYKNSFKENYFSNVPHCYSLLTRGLLLLKALKGFGLKILSEVLPGSFWCLRPTRRSCSNVVRLQYLQSCQARCPVDPAACLSGNGHILRGLIDHSHSVTHASQSEHRPVSLQAVQCRYSWVTSRSANSLNVNFGDFWTCIGCDERACAWKLTNSQLV